MSVEPDPGREAPPRAGALLARAENGDVRAGRRLASVAAALRTAEEDRLDDRTRAALGALIESLFGTIRAAIVQQAMPTLIADGHVDIVDTLSAPPHDAPPGDGGLAAIVLAHPACLAHIHGRLRQG